MKRGEIWWSDQLDPIGRRPVVLLSRDESYKVRNAVIVAQITTTIRNIPTEVLLDEADKMPKKCVINCDDIATIRKHSLVERIATLKVEKMEQIEKAIKFALSLK